MNAERGRQLLSDQVRDQLLGRIVDGSLVVGEKLPAEPELCEEFGVSRATIREAVRGLVEAGYLSRVHGSGTFVAFRPRLRHTLERNLSYSRLIEQAGLRPGRRVLTVTNDQADEQAAKALGVPWGEPFTRIERVRSADERPVIHSIDVVPSRYLSGVGREQLSGSFYALLEQLGHTVAHGEATLEPVLADRYRSRILQVEEGAPLLYISQVDYTTAGDAVMFSREWHVPGVFELSLLRRAN